MFFFTIKAFPLKENKKTVLICYKCQNWNFGLNQKYYYVIPGPFCAIATPGLVFKTLA